MLLTLEHLIGFETTPSEGGEPERERPVISYGSELADRARVNRPAWALILTLVVPSVACDDRTVPPPDPAGDAGGPGDASDAGPRDGSRPDPDGSTPDVGRLDATIDEDDLPPALAALTPTWTTTLELCNAWREGADFADEHAAETHLSLRPAARTGLDATRLATAGLGTSMVRRGTGGGAQWFFDGTAPGQLIHWMISDDLGRPRLSAYVAHDLGAAGVLVELIHVTASDGRPATVDWSDEADVSFAYAPPGQGLDTALPLVPCVGRAELEDAVEVIAGRGATRDVTVVRGLRTRPAVAGSSAIHLERALVMVSDLPRLLTLEGPLAQTYAAEHHNWVEHSRYDFTRDPVTHALYLAPEDGAESAPPGIVVERVDVIGVGGSPAQTPELELVRLDTRDGLRSTERLPLEHERWARVDDVELLRAASAECAAPEARAVGSPYAHWLQLVTCAGPGPLGRRLVMAVPVTFPGEPGVVGERLVRPAITERGSTQVIAVGASTVELSVGESGFVTMVVRDAQGEPRAETLGELAPLELPRPRDEVHAFTGPAGLVVELARRWGAQGSGRSAVYAPLSLEVVHEGRRHRVEALDRLRYTSSHHNWHDVLVADDGELVFEWRVRRIDAPEGTFLRISRRDGSEVLAETLLEEAP